MNLIRKWRKQEIYYILYKELVEINEILIKQVNK
jgi:hypothetical protein